MEIFFAYCTLTQKDIPFLDLCLLDESILYLPAQN
jgi:hypothetical protein